MNIVEWWRTIVRYRLMVLGIVFSTTALSILGAFIIQPVYRSEVLLAPAASDNSQGNLSALVGQLGGLATLAGIDIGSTSSTVEAIAILKSRSFTREFLDDENLMPVLFSDDWNTIANDWVTDDPSEIPTFADAYELFDEAIRTVRVDNKTELVALGIEWTDPELAAKWANMLVSRLNRKLRSSDIAEAQQSIEFLNKELAKNSVLEIRQGIFRLIEHQVKIVMLANVREEYAFKILDKAVVADPDHFIWPKRKIMVMAGFSLGVLFAAMAIFLRIAWENVNQ